MKKTLIVALAALLVTGCTGRGVKRSIAMAMSFYTDDSTLEANAAELGCTMAMTMQQADTLSVLYFSPADRSVYTMTYVSYDRCNYGRGGDYTLDSVEMLNPYYGTSADGDSASFTFDDPECVLSLVAIERGADSLRCRVEVEGEEPVQVRLKLYGKARGMADPLASADVQHMLVLGLSLRYPVEEIEATRQRTRSMTDSLDRALDSADRALDRAMAEADRRLDSLDRRLDSRIDCFGQLQQLAQQLGFAHQEYHEYIDRAEMLFVGGKCKVDACHARMERLAEEAGSLGCAYTVQHRPGHRSCRFKAERWQ